MVDLATVEHERGKPVASDTMSLEPVTKQLITGARIPKIGLGTWLSKPGEIGMAINTAIDCGYRHVDCASLYMNEHEIGNALQEIFAKGKVMRKDVFITSKLSNPYHRKQHVKPILMKTLQDLQIKQLDLYLMHFPVAFKYVPFTLDKTGIASYQGDPADGGNGANIDHGVSIRETWEAIEECFNEGLVKAIGVSNFSAILLHDLMSYAKVKPAVNQIESHPYCQQAALLQYMTKNNIIFEAYSPLGTKQFSGKSDPVLLDDPVLKSIAEKYKTTAAMICLRWAVQRGTVCIPKSVNTDRIQSNIDVFGFKLDCDDMKRIATIDKNHHYLRPNDWYGIPLFTP